MSEQEKRLVGERAADLVQPGSTLGLGTGSTVRHFAEALAARIRSEGLEIRAIPTSDQSRDLAGDVGIPLTDWTEVITLDLCVDGADEVSRDLQMVKGGGGALLREKIVAMASRKRVFIVDSGKLVKKLGLFKLPVEVIRFGYQATKKALEDEGALVTMREEAGSPYITDNGNFIFDCNFGLVYEPAVHHHRLTQIPGVIDTGFFIDMIDQLITIRDGTITLVDNKDQVFW